MCLDLRRFFFRNDRPLAERAVKKCDGAWLVGVIVPFIINIYAVTDAQAASKQKTGSKESSTMGWKVEQTSESEGQLSLLLTDSGLKLISPKQNLVCVSKAPNWNVVTVNKKENLGKEMKLEYFALGGYRIFGRDRGSKIQSRTKLYWQGRPAELVVRRLSESDPLKEKLEMLYQDSEARYAEVKMEKFLFEKWMNLRPELRLLLSGLYRVDKSSGLLLQRTSIYSSGKKNVLLKTLSVTRVPIESSQFAYPKGYKTVKSFHDLTMERRKREQAAGVLEDMFMDK